MNRMFVILTVALVFASPALHAESYKIAFWYPGEAGSTSEAEPILATFFDYLSAKLNTPFEGKYFNSVPEGIQYIKKSKPQFAIASWIALKENMPSLPPYREIAATLPLPDGATSDRFSIVGHKEAGSKGWSPPENLVILTSIPVNFSFLKQQMAPELKDSSTVKAVSNLLATLKKIAAEETPNTVALLTPMEKFTLDNLKSDWAAKLSNLFTCKPIPTAPLIYLDEKPAISDRLVEVLKSMPNDPEGKEILGELRLKGFK